jgi:hypothetical protein
MSHDSLELSPGFFDPQLAMSDEEDPIVPLVVDIEKSKKGDVIFNDENNDENNSNENDENNEINDSNENNNKNNVVEDIVFFMFPVQKGCGCSGGWKRTARY